MTEQALENLQEAGLVPKPEDRKPLARTEDYDEIDALLMGSPAAIKFGEYGATAVGSIVSVFARQATDFDSGEPKFWDDGQPIMEPVVILCQPDGEMGTLYVSSAGLRTALKEACRIAGKGLRPGGYLVVRYTKDGEPFRKGGFPPKIYDAQYAPPGRPPLPPLPELPNPVPDTSAEPPF